jgi:hypothetical protein
MPLQEVLWKRTNERVRGRVFEIMEIGNGILVPEVFPDKMIYECTYKDSTKNKQTLS